MDLYPIRRQITDLETQVLSLGESLALLPPDQAALAAADLERVRAALAELLASISRNQQELAEQDARLASPRRNGDDAPGEEGVVWTAGRTTRLYAINAALSLAVTPLQVAQIVVTQALPAVEADAGVILLSPDGTTFKAINESESAGADAALAGLVAGPSPLTDAAASVQPVWIESREVLLAQYGGWNAGAWSDSAAIAAVPLVIQGKVLGIIAFRFETPRPFAIADRAFMLVLAQQCAAALERVALYEQVRQAAALQERHRLARDLHDSVSQALYAIVLSATSGRANVDRDTAKVGRAFDTIQSLAAAGQADLRALLFDLRVDSVAQTGIVNALIERAQFLRLRHGLEVRTEFCPEPDVPAPIKEALYGIAREALHNAAKHARAKQVELSLCETARGLVLEIRDDGLGFELTRSRPGHYGLQSMRERAVELGAELRIESVANQGTRIIVVVPVGGAALSDSVSGRYA